MTYDFDILILCLHVILPNTTYISSGAYKYICCVTSRLAYMTLRFIDFLISILRTDCDICYSDKNILYNFY